MSLLLALFEEGPVGFPVVNSSNGGVLSTAGTSHTINLPAAVAAGELLLVAFVCKANPAITWDTTSHGTWTQLTNVESATPHLVVYWKVAAGTEDGGTLTVTTATSQKSAHQSWAIGDWDGIAPIAPAEVVYTATVNPDPPNNASGSGDSLWIALAAANGVVTVTSYPANYTDNQISRSTSASSAVAISAATRNLNASAENPGTFTNTVSGDGHAATIVVLPATAGTQALTPGLFTNTNTFFVPTVTTGAVALTPSLFTDGDTFFAPTVGRGAVGLTPALFTDGDTFFAPTVTTGVVGLTPALFTDGDTFFAPTVGRGAVGLTPALFTDGDTFFAPTVASTYSLTPSLFIDGDTFFSPTVASTYALTPSLFTDGDSFFSPTVTAGVVDLTPALFTDGDTFFPPAVVVEGGTQDLSPDLFVDGDTFFAPTVAVGAGATQDLAPSLFTNTNTFFTHIITGGAGAGAGAIDDGRRSRRLSKYRLRPISDKVYADRNEEEIIMAVVKEFLRVIQ